MKYFFNLKTLMFLMAMGFIISLNPSCSKSIEEENNHEELDNLNQTQSEFKDLVSREITLFDRSEKNKVTFDFYAESEEIIEDYLSQKYFEIEPIFSETFELDESSEVPGEQPPGFSQPGKSVTISIKSISLEESATGFILYCKFKNNNEIQARHFAYNPTYTSKKWWHHGLVCVESFINVNDPETFVRCDWEDKDQGLFQQWEWSDGFLFSNWGCHSHYHSGKWMRVTVQSNYYNYGVHFKHWAVDDWVRFF